MIENLNFQSGWFKIDRRLTAHWLWTDDRFLKWWLDLLMMAQYNQRKVLIGHTLVRLERGQLVASGRFLAKRWSKIDEDGNKIEPSRRLIARFFNLLIQDRMVTVNHEALPNRMSLITIENYVKYQDMRTTSDTTTDTTSDTTSDTTCVSTSDTKTEEYKEYKENQESKEECVGEEGADEGVVDKQQRDARSQGGGKVCRKKSFTPPEVKEVADWLTRKGWTDIDAEHFVAYYESNGWMIGRTPMRNWQAALVTWHRKNTSTGAGIGANSCQSTLNVNNFNRNHYESDFDRQRAEKSRRDAEFLAHIHAKLARCGAMP